MLIAFSKIFWYKKFTFINCMHFVHIIKYLLCSYIYKDEWDFIPVFTRIKVWGRIDYNEMWQVHYKIRTKSSGDTKDTDTSSVWGIREGLTAVDINYLFNQYISSSFDEPGTVLWVKRQSSKTKIDMDCGGISSEIYKIVNFE